MKSLFPGRDPKGGTDAEFDPLLEQVFRSQQSAPTCRQPASNPQPEPSTTYIRTARTRLLKPYWVVRAILLLALIQRGCNANSLVPHAPASKVAKATHTRLFANLREDSQSRPTTVESAFPPSRSMTWVREDEPTIEVTGPGRPVGEGIL